MSLFGNNKIKAFGLDISDTSIKVMQLEKSGAKIVPTAFGGVPLPDKVIANHLIVSEEKLAEAIKRAVDKARKISTKYVICSIPEAKSFVRTLNIPKMSDKEIEGAIPYELEQDIPIPVDQVYLDWQILHDSSDKMEILVTAATRDYVDSLVNALKMVNLVPVAMELESQATARAIIGKDDEQKTVLIADIATQQTSFIIVDNGVIQYTSSVPIAGNAFTDSIARNLGLPKGEAEKLKRTTGLTSEAKAGKVRASILPILDNIIDEIKNVVRFFEDHDTNQRKIQNIILCGGSAGLMGVTDYISARINLGSTKGSIQVDLGNPWVNLNGYTMKTDGTKSDEILGYSTVAGLALRGTGL